MNCCESKATRRARRIQMTLLLAVVIVLGVVAFVR